MPNFHFYQAKSRIGISNLTHKAHTLNIGVEKGPEAILTKEFLKSFPNFRINKFVFTKPEKIKKNFNQILLTEILQFRDLIIKTFKDREIQVVVGGDHVVSLAAFLALLKRAKNIKKIGYIHFDSHGDVNLFKSSPTKNFHGMYLRILLDKFDLKEFDKLIIQKIPKQNFLFIGDLELDKEETNFFSKNSLKNINHQMVQNNWQEVEKSLQGFINSFSYLHISFDVDVFNKKLVSATGTPSQTGFSKKQIFKILNILKTHPQISFDLCEVNPQKKEGVKTVKLAQEVLSFFLSSANSY